MRVLVANDPLAYREVISASIRELRPSVVVCSMDPIHLDEEFLRLVPGLVVCSRATALIEKRAFAWVELYPEHTSGAVVSLAGEKMVFDSMPFDVLLSILDEAGRLYESLQESIPKTL